MKDVELKVLDITQGTMANHPYFLILQEVDGPRKLSVMIGSAEAQAILVCLRRAQTPRPLLHDVMAESLENFGIRLHEVVIHKVRDGVFYSALLLQGEEDEYLRKVDARTSDAIALALRMKAPIYTTESLIEREHIYEDGKGSISIPISSVSINVLREALERALREENYELAAQLRDEIARRVESDN